MDVSLSGMARRMFKLADAAQEAVLQLEYLDEKYPTGTTPPVLARLREALREIGQQQNG